MNTTKTDSSSASVETTRAVTQGDRTTTHTETAAAAPEAPTKGWKYTDLSAGQIMGLRYSRSVAYKAGQYKMQPPPVCTTRWDDEAWQNWVQFDNENLTGFLPYTNATAED